MQLDPLLELSMKATGFRRFVQVAPGGHWANMRCCAPWPDSGRTGGQLRGKQAKDQAKGLKTTTELQLQLCYNLTGPSVLDVRAAKAFADKAVKMHKVFSVEGPYPVIRAALRARGWIEKRIGSSKQQVHQRESDERRANSNDAGGRDSDDDDVEKEQDKLHDLMSLLVQNEMVYFYWTNRRNAINTHNLHKDQIINFFAKAGSIATKVGLCVSLRNLHWFGSADPDTFFPRCHKLIAPDERHAFIEDFRRTACTSLLKYIVEWDQGVQGEGTSPNVQAIRDQRKQRKQPSGPVVLSHIINSALKVCQQFLDSLEHSDIDINLEASQTLTQEEWAQFIDSYYLVVHGGAEIENSDQFVTCCKNMLQRLEKVSPQLDIDGIYNIWIVKPGAMSRGRGIKCAKHLHEILGLMDGNPKLINESKWVVQKYLERPFLVHGTKFDVRQWFLVTDVNPLTVWFYKKCYLRFSTQPYSLDTLDSSVHLCNNSIQRHLRPSQQRHRAIPSDNMWSDEQFRIFLSKLGREAQWETVVVPGMKKAVIHALQAAHVDLMDSHKNTFELYGADFMLGCDLHPWLIEINSAPAMDPSTPVTAHLCPAVQEDTLRVVLDQRVDCTANTGDFQLIYKQAAAVEVPLYTGLSLLVEGIAIKNPCSLPPLRPSNHSVPKQRIHVKEKDPASAKLKHLPKKSVKSADTNTSRGVLSPPAPPPPTEPPVPVPIETSKFHLPMSRNKSVHLPVSDQSHAVLLWKRRA